LIKFTVAWSKEGGAASINIDDYPRLTLRFNQLLYKTPKHGNIYGLPLNAKGKVEKTEANALFIRDSIINSAKKDTTQWYVNGQY
jgi:hypothetical protein